MEDGTANENQKESNLHLSVTAEGGKPENPDNTTSRQSKPALDKFNETINDLGGFQIFTCVFAVLSYIPCVAQIIFFFFNTYPYEFECIPNTLAKCDPRCTDHNFYNISSMTNIIIEHELVCANEYKIRIVKGLFWFGSVVGCMIFGNVADRSGRKPAFLVAYFVLLFMGLLTALTPWYWLYCIAIFFVALSVGGWLICCFVFLVEYVGMAYREVVVITTQIPFTVGYFIIPLIAYSIPDWHKMQLVMFGVGLVFLTYYWIFPESPRWLLLTGQIEKCADILENITKGRNDNIPRREWITILNRAYLELRDGDYPKMGGIQDLFCTKQITKRTCILSLISFLNNLKSGGIWQFIIINSGIKDIHLRLIVVGFLQIAAYFITFLMTKYLRRRTVHLITSGLCGIALVFIESFPYITAFQIDSISLPIAIILMNITQINFYLIASETFPTVLRNSGLGFVLSFSFTGHGLALFVKQMSDMNPRIPQLIFATSAFLAAGIIFALPETKGAKLPDMVEGEYFKQKRSVN